MNILNFFNRLDIGAFVVGTEPIEVEVSGPGEDVGGELDGPDGGVLDGTDDRGELPTDVSDGFGELDGDMLDDTDD